MQIEDRLDAIHARVRRSGFLRRFTEFTRLLLGIGFFAPGLTKALGHRFTQLSVETPVGFFFEAMYQTGPYWRFIGLSQMAASILVLIPATAALGAVIFFPIILNIFIITVSLHFTGTPFITGPMLLAVTYLLCWDYHKFKPIFFRAPRRAEVPEVELHSLERIGYAMAAIGGIGPMLVIRGEAPGIDRTIFFAGLILGLIGGIIALFGWAKAIRSRSRLQQQPG